MTKKLMITGAAGFVGHHVVAYFLKNTDYDIVTVDRLDFSGNLNRLSDALSDFDADTKKRLKVVYHDLKAEFNDYICDKLGDVNIIFHLAAASHVTRSIKYPIEFVNDNIIGTVNVLEYARKLKNLERMIHFSTDEVFGPAVDDTPFLEWDRFNACNPYSASKAAAEDMCVAYENTYNLPIYITHTMNIYGERQSDEKYIPMITKKIYNGEKITIHYDSKTGKIGSRCYLHAKDVADALHFLVNLKEIQKPVGHRGGKCNKFNISSTDELNNLQVAQMVAKAMNKELKYELVDPNIDRPGHDFRYSISGEYLRSLGWTKTIDIEQGISNVVGYTVKGYENE
jgi:dTDP-glucose 4,6-dehydratase